MIKKIVVIGVVIICLVVITYSHDRIAVCSNTTSGSPIMFDMDYSTCPSDFDDTLFDNPCDLPFAHIIFGDCVK